MPAPPRASRAPALFSHAPNRARAALSCGLGLLCACASGPRNRPDPDLAPERYLEAKLISRREDEQNARTAGGGMRYRADFSPANPNALHLPFELLQAYCEQKNGRFSWTGHARTPAASLAPNAFAPGAAPPGDVVATLADADRSGIFGTFRCESERPTWTAHIEPRALYPTEEPSIWQLELDLKAATGSDLIGAGLPPASPPPPLAADGVQLPPGSAPVVTPESSPLNPQPVPPVSGAKLLEDPSPFGLAMGIDSPAVFARKLRLDLTHSTCRGAAEVCFDHPAASQAYELRARFADVGAGPVLAELKVRYPASAFDWLAHAFRNQYGPPDATNTRPLTQVWSWLHTTIQLSHEADAASGDALVHVTNKPTLERSHLPDDAPGRKQTLPPHLASPWQMQLGYEPAQLAQTKLQAAGFYIPRGGCSDVPNAHPLFARTCSLAGGHMPGLRSARVRIADIGDGQPRLAQLEYSFDSSAYDDTLRELRAQYGEPVPISSSIDEWWTGPVGIELAKVADGFTLRYFHGRLLQIYLNAEALSAAASRQLQHQGL